LPPTKICWAKILKFLRTFRLICLSENPIPRRGIREVKKFLTAVIARERSDRSNLPGGRVLALPDPRFGRLETCGRRRHGRETRAERGRTRFTEWQDYDLPAALYPRG
jgi:hypothetical protein